MTRVQRTSRTVHSNPTADSSFHLPLALPASSLTLSTPTELHNLKMDSADVPTSPSQPTSGGGYSGGTFSLPSAPLSSLSSPPTTLPFHSTLPNPPLFTHRLLHLPTTTATPSTPTDSKNSTAILQISRPDCIWSGYRGGRFALGGRGLVELCLVWDFQHVRLLTASSGEVREG